MLWDLLQHHQINREIDTRQRVTKELADQTELLTDRVYRLEQELEETRAQFKQLTEILENRFGEDLNSDGRVGR